MCIRDSSKLLYFLQLSDKVGTIIMTIRRIYTDIGSFFLIFFLCNMTFSFAIIYVTTMDPYIVSYVPLNESTTYSSKCMVGPQIYLLGAAAYQLGNISSRTINEVKQR